MNLVYAARFHPAEEGGYWIDFPDLEGCLTCGTSLAHAIEMAEEAMALYLSVLLDRGREINPPTPIQELDPQDGFLTYISADPTPLRGELPPLKPAKPKPVKKTLTIPQWLNEEAQKAGINFSKTLREALEQALAK